MIVSIGSQSQTSSSEPLPPVLSTVSSSISTTMETIHKPAHRPGLSVDVRRHSMSAGSNDGMSPASASPRRQGRDTTVAASASSSGAAAIKTSEGRRSKERESNQPTNEQVVAVATNLLLRSATLASLHKKKSAQAAGSSSSSTNATVLPSPAAVGVLNVLGNPNPIRHSHPSTTSSPPSSTTTTTTSSTTTRRVARPPSLASPRTVRRYSASIARQMLLLDIDTSSEHSLPSPTAQQAARLTVKANETGGNNGVGVKGGGMYGRRRSNSLGNNRTINCYRQTRRQITRQRKTQLIDNAHTWFQTIQSI